MNMKIKTLSFLTAFIVAGASSMQAQAYVPVIDATAIAQAVSQVNNQVQQIYQLQAQIKAATDNGNFAGLADNPLIRKELNKYLPAKYNDVFEAARSGDLGSLQGLIDKAQAQYNADKSTKNALTLAKARQFQADAQINVGYQQLNALAKSMNDMVNTINTTTNVAQKQDLTNTINAKSALINTKIGQLQLAMKQAERAEKRADNILATQMQQQMKKRQSDYMRAKYPANRSTNH